MLSLFRSELFRARKRAQTWITIGIAALGTLLFYAGFTIAHFFRPESQNIADTLQVANVKDEGLIILSLLGPIVGVVFGAGLIGSEYGWNTMRSLVARASTRSSLIVAKWAAAAVYVLAMVAGTVLVAYASATIGSIVAGEELSWGGSAIGDLVTSIGQYWLAIMPSVGVAVFVAIIWRSNAAAIAAGIAIIFVEPIIFALLGALSDAIENLQKAGLSYNASRVTSAGTNTTDAVSGGEFILSAAVLVAWLIGFVVVSIRVFQTRDVKSG